MTTILGDSPVTNPLDGVTPDMGILGPAFVTTWARVAGAVWALLIAAAVFYLAAAFLSMAQAKRIGNAHMVTDATGEVKVRAAALAGLIGLPVIVGTIITVVG
ncbi:MULTISPECIES: hypothetical protein [Actinoplanes]|uniref:hypothetical protein n=1 Tax=Actinoplanes TaxID=1865 RepID=UPI0005F2E20A|nr:MULTISPECIES: hypothetical protein [Actinoplanes]GLY02431.1 hypothetical protein Acsp01_28100 [Actinoplanes sp. NBRC 101535]